MAVGSEFRSSFIFVSCWKWRNKRGSENFTGVRVKDDHRWWCMYVLLHGTYPVWPGSRGWQSCHTGSWQTVATPAADQSTCTCQYKSRDVQSMPDTTFQVFFCLIFRHAQYSEGSTFMVVAGSPEKRDLRLRSTSLMYGSTSRSSQMASSSPTR